jgi:carbon-monoxide dehydrogenase small subunit
MLIAARDLVRRKGGLSRPEIRTEMSGNLCRCTGYQGIIDAIERVLAEPGDDGTADMGAKSWLGPAPGPIASSVSPGAAAVPASQASRREGRSAVAVRTGRTKRPPIAVEVGGIEEVDGVTRLTQRFVLPHPREAVWPLMSDVEAVARCMPGLALDGPPEGDKVAGRLEVKIGPITASFAGQGTLTPYPSDFRQVISGSGGDRRSGSRASGSVDYRLYAIESDATRVEVAISYTLTGPLAQIGRSGIVRDLVRRIGEAFAQNIDAQLAEPGVAAAAAPLGGISLFFQLFADRVRAFLARLLGRRG